MSKRFQFGPIAVLTAIVMILVFQNCSQTSQETSNSSLEEATPFAYSAQVDTIAHMTCAGLNDSGPDRRAYFSFRVGAYNPATGGLSTTQEFRDHTAYFNVDQRARVFGISARNSNTNLSLSIRSVADYQRVWKEGVIRDGEELDALVPDLDSARIAGPLAALAPGQRINYFPSSAEHRLFEGSLRYYHFENTMSEMRSALDQRQSFLAVSYSNTSDVMDTRLRVPSEDPRGSVSSPANRAYGTGYFIRFGFPGVATASEPRVILPNGGIEEIDLRTGASVASNWDCSVGYQFEIVLPDDLRKTPSLMSPTVDQTPTDADSLAALIAIRRVLRVEDWFVDLSRRRVMAKRDDYCYSSLNGRTVQYGQPTCVNSSSIMCSHYVSVCMRR